MMADHITFKVLEIEGFKITDLFFIQGSDIRDTTRKNRLLVHLSFSVIRLSRITLVWRTII